MLPPRAEQWFNFIRCHPSCRRSTFAYAYLIWRKRNKRFNPETSFLPIFNRRERFAPLGSCFISPEGGPVKGTYARLNGASKHATLIRFCSLNTRGPKGWHIWRGEEEEAYYFADQIWMIPKRNALIFHYLSFKFFNGKVEALNELLLWKQDYEQTMCQNLLFNKNAWSNFERWKNCQAYCCVTSMTWSDTAYCICKILANCNKK